VADRFGTSQKRLVRDEILVKIRSSAVNHLDLVEASGTARQILPIDLPWIPGHEF
jgi:D-arabinose 1-dehydrogenase-like Zn-dependent alcohol dehydrogenase